MEATRKIRCQELLQAVLNADELLIRELIENHGADVNYHPGTDIVPLILNDASIEHARAILEERVMSNTAFGTPLLLATQRQDQNTMVILLEYGAEVDYDQRTWFETALRELALEGAHEMIKLLGQYGDRIAATPRTALCASAMQNNAIPRAQLLSSGANPNFPLGWPLVAASLAGNDLGVCVLLGAGAVQIAVSHWTLEMYDKEQNQSVKNSLFSLVDLSKRSEVGWSALGMAVSGGFIKIVEMLLTNGTLDISICHEAFWLASRLGKDDVVQAFLTHGVKPNFGVRYVQGTPLNAAARNGCDSTVALLLRHDADPNLRFKGASSPLEDAVALGRSDIVKMLLDAGAGQSQQKKDDNTPLIKAVEKRDIELCELLLSYGADINASCSYLGNALQVAAATGDRKMFVMLRSRGAKLDVKEDGLNTTIGAACGGSFAGGGNIDIIKTLLDAGVDINQSTATGTPLQIAAEKRKELIVKFLVEKGADINTRSNNYKKNTPIESAVIGGDVEIVKYLLGKGAQVTNQAILLKLAATFAKEDLIEFLMDEYPQLAQLENLPEILDSAAKSEYFNNIQAILMRTKKDVATDYTLKKAVRSNKQDLVKLLLSRGCTVKSALGMAFSYKRKEICWTLLNTYINDEDDQLLNSTLRGAAFQGWQDMVIESLDRGANVNHESGAPESLNVLQIAVQSGHLPTIRLLLDRGADMSSPGALGKALQLAGENEKIKRLLVSKGRGPETPLPASKPLQQYGLSFELTKVSKLAQAEEKEGLGYEAPQPPLVAHYRVGMSAPMPQPQKTKQELDEEFQAQVQLENQALKEFREKTSPSTVGPATVGTEAIAPIERVPGNEIARNVGPYGDSYLPLNHTDDLPDEDAQYYDHGAKPAPAETLRAAIQPPVDGLEKPAPISDTVQTCNLTLAVFRSDSKGSIQRKLQICKQRRPDRLASDIDTDEKLFKAMRKAYKQELSSFLRRLLSLKSLKQITVLSYTATTRPTLVPYDDFTLQEIMFLFNDPSSVKDEHDWIEWVFRLKTASNGRKHILRFEETWDGSKIAIAGSLPIVVSCLIGIIWSARGGDIQTVFAVASFVLGAGTALLALVAILSSVGS